MIISEIKKLLNPDVLIDMDTLKGILRIKESGVDAKLKKVDIMGVNVNSTVAFKLDYYNQLTPYLNRSEKNINKGCDAIIFTQVNNQNHLLICELKSYAPKEVDFVAKMKNSSIFLECISALLRTFFPSDLASFKKKYILFYLKKINKRTTLPRQMITSERLNGIIIHKVYNYREIHIGKLINL